MLTHKINISDDERSNKHIQYVNHSVEENKLIARNPQEPAACHTHQSNNIGYLNDIAFIDKHLNRQLWRKRKNKAWRRNNTHFSKIPALRSMLYQLWALNVLEDI